MAGRKRSTAFKLTSAKHNVRGLIVPQGAAGALQLRSRYVLAGGSAVVGLLLGVWAVTALHRLHTRVRMDVTVVAAAHCQVYTVHFSAWKHHVRVSATLTDTLCTAVINACQMHCTPKAEISQVNGLSM